MKNKGGRPKKQPIECIQCGVSSKKTTRGLCPLCDIRERRKDSAYREKEREADGIRYGIMRRRQRKICYVCGIIIGKICERCYKIHAHMSPDGIRCVSCFNKGLMTKCED